MLLSAVAEKKKVAGRGPAPSWAGNEGMKIQSTAHTGADTGEEEAACAGTRNTSADTAGPRTLGEHGR